MSTCVLCLAQGKAYNRLCVHSIDVVKLLVAERNHGQALAGVKGWCRFN